MSVDLTPEIWEEIKADLRKTRAPSRTARNLGYGIHLVLQVQNEESQPRTTREERYGGMGHPDVERFTVARKKVTSPWNNFDPDIAEARQRLEDGTHTMCTGYDGEWAILYSIPLKKLDPKPGYFLPENAL